MEPDHARVFPEAQAVLRAFLDAVDERTGQLQPERRLEAAGRRGAPVRAVITPHKD